MQFRWSAGLQKFPREIFEGNPYQILKLGGWRLTLVSKIWRTTNNLCKKMQRHMENG